MEGTALSTVGPAVRSILEDESEKSLNFGDYTGELISTICAATEVVQTAQGVVEATISRFADHKESLIRSGASDILQKAFKESIFGPYRDGDFFFKRMRERSCFLDMFFNFKETNYDTIPKDIEPSWPHDEHLTYLETGAIVSMDAAYNAWFHFIKVLEIDVIDLYKQANTDVAKVAKASEKVARMRLEGYILFAKYYRGLSASHNHFEKTFEFNSFFAWQNKEISKKDLFKTDSFVKSCQIRSKAILSFK